MMDIQKVYAQLANDAAISTDEIIDLLKELQHFRTATAYLASCQAATLESLRKSAGQSERARHNVICKTAAQLLQGDASAIRGPVHLQHAIDRCQRAANGAAHVDPDSKRVGNATQNPSNDPLLP